MVDPLQQAEEDEGGSVQEEAGRVDDSHTEHGEILPHDRTWDSKRELERDVRSFN